MVCKSGAELIGDRNERLHEGFYRRVNWLINIEAGGSVERS
jgi:hypothetical protein